MKHFIVHFFLAITFVIGLAVEAAATPVTSPNLTRVPSATSIVDTKLVTWTLGSTGLVLKNGVGDGQSSNVKMLLFYNSVLYQENKTNLFYSWNGTKWTGPIANPLTPSPTNTTIPKVTTIIDNAAEPNIWTLSGGVVYENGAPAGYSSGVTELLYQDQVIYQQNFAGSFWSWNGTAWVASPLNGIVTPLDTASIQARTSACLPVGMAATSTLQGSTHKVFAHYMLNFTMSIGSGNIANPQEYYTAGFINPKGETNNEHLPYGGYLRSRPLPVATTSPTLSQDNYENEIRLAMAIGIDGFSTDIMNASTSTVNPLGHITIVRNLLAAAAAVNKATGAHFTILPIIDASAFSKDATSQADIISALEDLRTDPNIARLPDGRLAFGSFLADGLAPTISATIAEWTAIIAQLQKDEGGLAANRPAFIPIFLSMGAYSAANGTTGAFDKLSYMISTWGDRTPAGSLSQLSIATTMHAKGLGFMTGIAPQDFRPKDQWYDESGNSASFRNAWTSALGSKTAPVADQADWVQIVTWNDYSEHTHLTPSFGTQYGFYDLAGYYIGLFKGGHGYVGRDSVTLFFRDQLAGANAPAPNAIAQSLPFKIYQSDAGATNNVEAVVFTDSTDFKLGEPTLTITVGGVSTSFPVKVAGLTTYSVPITFPSAGNPATVSAKLVVPGSTTPTVQLTAPQQIKQSILVDNFLVQSATASQVLPGGTAVSCGFPGQAQYQPIVETLYQNVISGK